jgi:hypothetical protein
VNGPAADLDSAEAVAVGRQAVVGDALGVPAQRVDIDPERAVEHDPELPRKLGPTDLQYVLWQVAEVEVLGRTLVVTFPRGFGKTQETAAGRTAIELVDGTLRCLLDRRLRLFLGLLLLEHILDVGLLGVRRVGPEQQHRRCGDDRRQQGVARPGSRV